MAFLIIAGITIQVAPNAAQEQAPVEVGADSFAYAGNLRSTIRVEKRRWQFTTKPITHAAYETLLAATNLGQIVACTGDSLPVAGITARVKLTRTFVKIRGGSRSLVQLTVQEA